MRVLIQSREWVLPWDEVWQTWTVKLIDDQGVCSSHVFETWEDADAYAHAQRVDLPLPHLDEDLTLRPFEGRIQ